MMRRGVTLIELIVVIAILGVMAGVAALGFRGVRPRAAADATVASIEAARDSALRTGHAVRVMAHPRGDSLAAPVFALALPDGRVIASAELNIDPLTGRRAHAAP